jgi:hypothetical protein
MLNFCREINPVKKINRAAVGAIKPRYVQGGISFRPIFRKGHEVPQPIVMMISSTYPNLVRPFLSIYFKTMKRAGVHNAGPFFNNVFQLV